MKETLAEQIARERREMALKPWQLAPSEVDAGPSPWPRGSAGFDAWQQARQWRTELLKRDPSYFNGQ